MKSRNKLLNLFSKIFLPIAFVSTMLFGQINAVITVNNIELFLKNNGLDLAGEWYETVSPFCYCTKTEISDFDVEIGDAETVQEAYVFSRQARDGIKILKKKILTLFNDYAESLNNSSGKNHDISSPNQLKESLEACHLLTESDQATSITINMYQLVTSKETREELLELENNSIKFSSIIEKIGILAASYLNQTALQNRSYSGDEYIFDYPLMPLVIDWSTKNNRVTIIGAPEERQDLGLVAESDDCEEDESHRDSTHHTFLKTLKILLVAYLATFTPPITQVIKEPTEDLFLKKEQENRIKFNENQNK